MPLLITARRGPGEKEEELESGGEEGRKRKEERMGGLSERGGGRIYLMWKENMGSNSPIL